MNLRFALLCLALIGTQSCGVQSINSVEDTSQIKKTHPPILLACQHHSSESDLLNCLHYALQERLRAKIANADYMVDIKGIPHVEVGFTITEKGNIEDIQALNGHQAFFELAEKMVMEVAEDIKNENTLLPAYQNNKPIQKHMVIKLLFK